MGAGQTKQPANNGENNDSSVRLRLKRIFKVANDIQEVPNSPVHQVPDENAPSVKSKRSKSNNCFGRGRESPEPSVCSPSGSMTNCSDREFGTPSITRSRRKRRSLKKVLEHFDARILAKYDIRALIGKGSFSRVVRVQNVVTRDQFAVKLVPAKNGTGPFENEIAILSRIRHPFVIKLQEVFRTTSRVYLVMELACGGELYDRIVSKGTFTEPETVSSIRMVLSGLQYLHRLGITHRDLKPENLLYVKPEPDSRLVITDFGLAHQRASSETEELMSETCGTPEYIAPEVLLRLPYNNKVDSWAVGVISYILLSGIMPFDDRSRTYLYRQIMCGRYYFYPEFWSSVSHEAKGFVSALLDTEPSERLSPDAALRHPWMLSGGQTRAINSRAPLIMDASVDSSLNGSTSSPYTTAPSQHVVVAAERERTRSNRSIRSVARSDHGHRVDPKEVERLVKDPEIRRMLNEKCRRMRPGAAHSDYGTMESTKEYGLI